MDLWWQLKGGFKGELGLLLLGLRNAPALKYKINYKETALLQKDL